MSSPILFAEHDPVALAAAEVFSVPRLGGSFAREIASEEATNPHSRLTSSYLLGDPHPSKILRYRSDPHERLGELYTRMLADTSLSGFVDKRIDAVLGLPRRIVPADGSPAAKETADFARQVFRLIPRLDVNLRHQALAFWYGIAIDEVMIEKLTRGPLAGAWVVVDLLDRPMHRFAWKQRELYIVKGLGKLELAPPENFLVARAGTKDNSWGDPAADDCYWPWWLKKNGLKFWATFLDKYGMPTAIGHYNAGQKAASGDVPKTSQALQETLHAALQRIQTEYAITLPDGLDIKFLEAQRAGGVSYEQFIGMLDRALAVKILGEVDTSGAAKGPGSFAKADVSNDVRLEKVVLDAHNLSAQVTDNLLRPMVAWNFGPDAPCPRFEIDAVDASDREQRSKGAEAVLAEEQPVGRRYFYMTHQVPEPEPGEPVILRKKAAPPVVVTPPPGAPPANDPADPADPDAGNEGDETPPGDPADSQNASRRARRSAAAAHHRGAQAGGSTPPPASTRRSAAAADDPAAELDPAAIQAELDAMLEQARERQADYDEVAALFGAKSLAYYTGPGGWKEQLLAAFDSGDVMAGTALRKIVGAVNPVGNARLLETAQIHGMGLSYRNCIEDFGRENIRQLSIPQGWGDAVNPQTAIEYWAGQLELPKDQFLGLSDGNRRLAFTVAGVTDLDLLHGIYLLVGQAIAGGWSRDQFVPAVERLFTLRGLEPLAKWHIELVYANNVRQAGGLVRFQQLVLNKSAARLTPYLGWGALDDGHTRPEHELMRGYIAAQNHPIWRMWWTPAGHNCRCEILAFSRFKALKLGLMGSEPVGPWPIYQGAPVLPDEGFRGAPETEFRPVIDEMDRRAQDALFAAQDSGSPDFADAAQQIYDQLYGGNGGSPTGFAHLLYRPEAA